MVLSPDKMGSKNNFFPKATPSTVCGLSTGITGANILSLNSFGMLRELGVATYCSTDSFSHEKQTKTIMIICTCHVFKIKYLLVNGF